MLQPDEIQEAIDLTERLVRISSVSPSEGENRVAECLDDYFRVAGIDVLEGPHRHLPDGRRNCYASLGHGKRTLILSGHMDTVGIDEYAILGEPAEVGLDPVRLAEVLGPRFGDRWLYGRGALDMKGALALCATVMARLARAGFAERSDLRILFLGVCDEENASAGIREAVRFLVDLQETEGLDYLGFVNTDYTSALFPGDESRYFYKGSIGKLLPSILIHGQTTHVGEPFSGVNPALLAAEILTDLEMNLEFCDQEEGEITPPPTTLRLRDLKDHYDVQTPWQTHLYLNFFCYKRTPSELMAKIESQIRATIERVWVKTQELEAQWFGRLGAQSIKSYAKHHKPAVLTLEALRADVRLAGSDPDAIIQGALADHAQRLVAAGVDANQDRPREAAREAVRVLWEHSTLALEPGVVLYLSPPFYPGIRSEDSSPLVQALEAVAAEFSARGSEVAKEAIDTPRVQVRRYYPYISDSSLVTLPTAIRDEIQQIEANMPTWGRAGPPDFDLLRRLEMPVVNMGPYGFDAHTECERVDPDYSFRILPRMMEALIERLS